MPESTATPDGDPSAAPHARDIYVSAPRYVLGETFHDVAALEELPAQARTMLLEFGLSRYCTSARSPLALAAQTVASTLAAAAMTPDRIDTVVLATNSFGEAENFHHRQLARWMSDLGLADAYPIGVTFSYCGNIHSALRMIGGLIRGGDARRVLLVCTDRVAPGETRLVPPAISVSSDGAASCIVSDQPSAGAYRVRAVAQASNARLAPEESEGRFVQYLQGLATGIRKTFEELLVRAALQRADIGALIPNNYNSWVNGNLARALNLPRSALFAQNIGRIAHVNTADNLINLRDWETHAAADRAGHVLMLGTGPNMWGLTLLQPVT